MSPSFLVDETATAAPAQGSAIRALCERSGFAENFEATTGRGLRDGAYTWTAAVYVVLSREFVARA